MKAVLMGRRVGTWVALGAMLAEPAWAALAPGDFLVTDQTLMAVVRINPVSGSKKILSQGGLLQGPRGICVSESGDIYVADASGSGPGGAVVRIDPANGGQAIVSAGGLLQGPSDVTLGPAGDLFVTNRGSGIEPRIIRVNPTSGQQDLVASGPPLVRPTAVVVEPSGDLLVVDFAAMPSPTGAGAVFRVHLSTGDVDTVTHGQLIRFTRHIAVSPTGRICISEFPPISGAGRILEVDPTTGMQTIVAQGGAILVPEDLEFLGDDTLIVVERDGFTDPVSFTDGGVLRVNLTTAEQDTVASRTLLGEPFGLAVYRGGATPATPTTWGAVKNRYRR